MRLRYLCFAITLTGCSSQEIYQPEYSQRVYSIEKPVGKDTTLAWYNGERLGAAYTTEAYKHVLTKRNTAKLTDLSPGFSFMLPNDPASTINQVKTKSYTVYETQRWERFCGEGKMDSRDWDFVAQEGRENIPEQLKEVCTPPAYTRQEFIEAWQASCGNNPPTASQAIIREKTIAPSDVCAE